MCHGVSCRIRTRPSGIPRLPCLMSGVCRARSGIGLAPIAAVSKDRSSAAGTRVLVERTIDEAMDDLAERERVRASREAVPVRSTRDRLARIGLALALPALVVAVVWNVSSVSAVAA